ncbi:MAG: uracil-DNA glycosylase family protein [Longimicrobiales bacterium]
MLSPADLQEEARFRSIFQRIHAQHPNCLRDEWVREPCRLQGDRVVDRPSVWSRRNGPWRPAETLWIGAAPGNAGGKGRGQLGAHGTRIPFGGDIAGGNLDVMLGSIGLDRNHTFIAASLNHLPAAGGGEPTVRELTAPIGDYPSSLHVVRDTIVAVQPKLLIALGNVALRVVFAATRLEQISGKLPSLKQLQKLGLERNEAPAWPVEWPPDGSFLEAWNQASANAPLPHVLWLIHPSAQNMSPYAGRETMFHVRMREAVAALGNAARTVLNWNIPNHRSEPPAGGIYALSEWRELVAPRHHELSRLWQEKGI